MPRCSETRRLPELSSPIAASTWLGSSTDALQLEPLLTAKPLAVEPPQQPLAVEVRGGEGREVGEPVDRVADGLEVGDRRRHAAAQAVDERPQPGVLGRRLGGGGLQPDRGGEHRRQRRCAGHPVALPLVGGQR